MRHKNNELLQQILEFINEKSIEENYCPSMQEIAKQFSISKSTAHEYVCELEDKGCLNRTRENGRYNLITKESAKHQTSILNIPVVGEIACGSPILAEENIESYVYISKEFLGEGKFFALRTKGDSMINAGINDGDVVIVRQQNTAEEGQIVVALVDDEATLKRYFFDAKRKQVRLHPENQSMEDMFYDRVDIQGIVKKVIKDVA